jgi:hypothetical protein
LRGAGVERLIDVRKLPLSRRRGFSKTALGLALRESGIEHIHVKALGNPKPNCERYWAGDIEGGAAVYRNTRTTVHAQRWSNSLKALATTRLVCSARPHRVSPQRDRP